MGNNLEFIIEELSLTKRGSYYAGKCPWCKVEGFLLCAEKLRFYCFGCRTSGCVDESPQILNGLTPLDDKYLHPAREEFIYKKVQEIMLRTRLKDPN